MAVLGYGPDIVAWLKSAGIICCDRAVRRVIIDIPFDDSIVVYVEEFGSEKIFKVAPPDLSGAKVVVGKTAPKAAVIPQFSIAAGCDGVPPYAEGGPSVASCP